MAEHLGLVWAGYGIRLHGHADRFRKWLEETRFGCVTTWTAADLLPTDHPQNIGIVGISGQRGANKAVTECDFLLALGTSLSLPQTSTVKPWSKCADNISVIHGEKLADFFDAIPSIQEPSPWAHKYKPLNPPPLEGSYALNDTMTRLLPSGSIMVVDGGGTALYTGFQSSYIKEGSRLICSSAMSAMGSGLPEAIGASFAAPTKLVSCLIGDGSLMLNLQELQTIRHHNLNIKIFVINNGGYLAIRQTQAGFLGGRFAGVGAPDISFPELPLVASAFGIRYTTDTTVALSEPGPALCEWFCPSDQRMIRQKYTKDGERFVPHDLSEMDYA